MIPLKSLYHNARRLSLRESAGRPTALRAGRLVIITCPGVFFKDFWLLFSIVVENRIFFMVGLMDKD